MAQIYSRKLAPNIKIVATGNLLKSIEKAWELIPPVWPINNFIARNPLSGFESLPFKEALELSAKYFQISELPPIMEEINRETIKWSQAFFDTGQAVINMPMRHLGFYKSWKSLILWDSKLHQNNQIKKAWIEALPEDPKATIELCLNRLNIPLEDNTEFLRLLLTTLPGWAGYVKYNTIWSNTFMYPLSLEDYLAVRLVITVLLWPRAAELLDIIKNTRAKSTDIAKIEENEEAYRCDLFKNLKGSIEEKLEKKCADAQLVFCIDVRSEPFRRALETQGNYETLGFAGFFGVPVSIKKLNSETIDACPAIIKPKYLVEEEFISGKSINIFTKLRKLYQSLKYTFTCPFTLAEAIGPWAGLTMIFKTLNPILASNIKNFINYYLEPKASSKISLENIELNDKCNYAENALRMIGLTNNFSPLVIFCGHGGETKNNPYAAGFDCGACGGNPGGNNAKILASLLNEKDIRNYLKTKGITIPETTCFMGAEHNTTTDEVIIYDKDDINEDLKIILDQLEENLEGARYFNNKFRGNKLNINNKFIRKIFYRSKDWAQPREEWGLSRNASFIIGPREITKELNLDGRSFLHSYDWKYDHNGEILEKILTGPLVVTQWINNQYLFSTLDNIAYGGGSKITQNITGKIGIMQGNKSDLMHGLALQSVNIRDDVAYHEALRLLTCVYAPRELLNNAIEKHENLRKLVVNEWIFLSALDPNDSNIYTLQKDLSWKVVI